MRTWSPLDPQKFRRLRGTARARHHGRVDETTRLALAARDRDPVDVAAFVRHTQVDVWRLCAHLVDVRAADDLAQDTYVRAIAALPRFRGIPPPARGS
jgi:RNA polymerase sigma-70 factor (ECF subfamily)